MLHINNYHKHLYCISLELACCLAKKNFDEMWKKYAVVSCYAELTVDCLLSNIMYTCDYYYQGLLFHLT